MSSPENFDQTIKVNAPGSGTMVFNRYKLDRIIGRGGMGVVWLAMDTKLEREVALKFLPNLVGLDQAAVKELKTETRRGLDLSHPHIIRIYDFVDDDDSAAISMEFVEGQTLSDLRMTRDPVVFSAEELADILPGVCDALDYAHFQRKIVHRDLKPANIMVTKKDRVAKIADFGISRSISDTMSRLSMSQMGISGTLPYMSPQQAMGDRPSPADDIYSLGATIYELLSGKPPFFRGDIATQITSKIPARMEERREELEIKASDRIPKEWEEVIAACLHKDPSLRPPSAGKLLELLGLKGGTSAVTQAYSPTAKVAGASKAPRGRTPIYAAAAALVVLGAGAAMYLKPDSKPAIAEQGPKPAPQPVIAEEKTAVTAAPAPAKPETPVPAVAATPPPAPAVVPQTPTAAPASVSVVTAAPTSPAAMPTVVAAPSAAPAQTAGTPTVALPASSQTAAAPTVAAAPATPPNPGMIQPPVTEPPNGSWPFEMLFPTPPQATYSESGRRKLLYKVQGLLKEKQLYSSTQDGKEGKGTHNAIILFQAKNSLVPNGLLDGPTLTAMALMEEPDDLEWRSPPPAVGSGGFTRKKIVKEDPNFIQRAGKSIGRFFNRDDD
ncbi:MAG: protein kinase [Prosthecobacter sp.]|jgi:hypothetical protein|uniref:serine/threonine-protein kinase n=1 Tax=Prosthecobacter sp. TaxID=1965333 RepID=UPI0019F9E05B|nr:serine/threonine-protein kinase [Prosthecobacter sp.]MBE2282888.1 protein kinase [Prosthecobacter sp.]